jgi:hypothetical protein
LLSRTPKIAVSRSFGSTFAAFFTGALLVCDDEGDDFIMRHAFERVGDENRGIESALRRP